MLGSGNLGLVYLMEERRRLTLEEIAGAHPRLLPALREHPHVGWLLVHSERARGGRRSAPAARTTSPTGRVEGEDPLAPFSPNAPQHLLRTDGFAHVADIMVGSFYDPALDTGCAFEELISFHGGIGGPQTRPFLLFPDRLPLTDEPIVGAASVHDVLVNWRRLLNDGTPPSRTGPSPTGVRCSHDRDGCPGRTRRRRGISPGRRWLIIALVDRADRGSGDIFGWDMKGWFSGLWHTITSISLADLLGGDHTEDDADGCGGIRLLLDPPLRYPGAGALAPDLRYLRDLGRPQFDPAGQPRHRGHDHHADADHPGRDVRRHSRRLRSAEDLFRRDRRFPYLYLFFTVGGSFDIQFKFIKDHPWAVAVILIAGAHLDRDARPHGWPRVLKWWDQAKEGGQILSHPSAYFLRVVTPRRVVDRQLCVMRSSSRRTTSLPFHTLMRIWGRQLDRERDFGHPGGRRASPRRSTSPR